jgi:hypothetical protein
MFEDSNLERRSERSDSDGPWWATLPPVLDFALFAAAIIVFGPLFGCLMPVLFPIAILVAVFSKKRQ